MIELNAVNGAAVGCSALLCPVSVLFCCDQSPYKVLAGVDVWDKKRDARRFAGAGPIIAHPPCRLWGNLRTVATKAPLEEKELGPWAVEQVRRCGGVLEHPEGSILFEHCNCGTLGNPDKWGGWILELDQWHWGHPAAKPTKLYIVGCAVKDVPACPNREGNSRPLHQPGARRPHRSSAFQISRDSIRARSNTARICKMARGTRETLQGA